MIKAVVTKRVALTADVGSVVYISEGQFAALQGKVEPYKEEAKAVEEVKEIANFVSKYKGGFGAVREFCDHILKEEK